MNWFDFNQYLLNQMNRHLNAFFEEQASTLSAYPPCNLYETNEGVVLVAEVPGFKESELQLSVVQDVVTLSGERKAQEVNAVVHRRERAGNMKFSRSFTLPYRVDTNRVEAELVDGVLTVKLPRHPEEAPRHIQIAKK